MRRGIPARCRFVLLVDDDPRIRQSLSRLLQRRGHAVRTASSGFSGLQDATDNPPDVVVLDLGLPDVDGFELLKMLRAVCAVPVIVATARDDEAVIVACLDAGADDYVVKPFSGEQLDARIRALLAPRRYRRRRGVHRRCTCGDPAAREATLDGRRLDLSRREFDLLAYLAAPEQPCRHQATAPR